MGNRNKKGKKIPVRAINTVAAPKVKPPTAPVSETSADPVQAQQPHPKVLRRVGNLQLGDISNSPAHLPSTQQANRSNTTQQNEADPSRTHPVSALLGESYRGPSFFEGQGQYLKYRLIESLPELLCAFPDDPQKFEAQFDAYKATITEKTELFKQMMTIEDAVQRSMLYGFAESSWHWMKDDSKCIRTLNAQVYYNHLRAFQDEKNAKAEVKEKREFRDLLQYDRPTPYVPGSAHSFGGRVSWKNGRARGLVFYDELGARALARHSSIKLMSGVIVASFRQATVRAFENAMYHRFYSELMSLRHTPWALQLAMSDLGITDRKQAYLYAAKQHQFEMCLDPVKKKLGALQHIRTEKTPLWNTGGVGNFHFGKTKPEWLHALNGAMEVFASLPDDEKREVRDRILAGEDRGSFYAYDVQELGPLMNALRGYHDVAANYRRPDFIPAPWHDQNYDLVGPYFNEKRSIPNLFCYNDFTWDPLDDTPQEPREPIRNVKTHNYYDCSEASVPENSFILDTQRGHQALQFQHELNLLHKRLNRTKLHADREWKDTAWDAIMEHVASADFKSGDEMRRHNEPVTFKATYDEDRDDFPEFPWEGESSFPKSLHKGPFIAKKTQKSKKKYKDHCTKVMDQIVKRVEGEYPGLYPFHSTRRAREAYDMKRAQDTERKAEGSKKLAAGFFYGIKPGDG